MSTRAFLAAIVTCSLSVTLSFAQLERLRPSKKYDEFWKEIDGPARTYRFAISSNRKLVSVGDTIYRLDRKNRIVWEWAANVPFYDAPIVDSEGTIYVVGYDLLWAAIDSATGKLKWRGTMNGRAAFTQLRRYGRDRYLVVIDMGGYRGSLRDNTIKDRLSLCKRNSMLWQTSIPANSRIESSGGRILVSYKRKQRLVRMAIKIPKYPGKPIGRISAFADDDGRRIADGQ